MKARRRLLVVVNPGASRCGQALGGAVTALFSAGFALDIRQTDKRDTLRAIVRADADADAIVIGGGDGTLNSALPALIEAGKPVGVLPLGTANDLARTLGIPANASDAAGVIASGALRRIDVGKVNDVHFLNVANIGLAVDVAEQQDPELKRHLGALSYAVTVLRTLGNSALFAATIECGGNRERVNACQITVGNGVHYGGGMRVARDAAIDDGRLDILAIETGSIPDLIAMAPAFLDGSLGERDGVRFFRSETARVETESPMRVSTDGEVTTQTPADFSILRSALEVFAPL